MGRTFIGRPKQERAPALLSGCLQRLELDGIVDRRVIPTAPPTVEYELTELGRELLPAVDAIVEVGHRLKQRREDASN